MSLINIRRGAEKFSPLSALIVCALLAVFAGPQFTVSELAAAEKSTAEESAVLINPPVFSEQPCPFPPPLNSEVVCGEVAVYENREQKSGVVYLPVARILPGGGDFFAKFFAPKIPAVVLGGGGPGAPVFLRDEAAVAFWNRFRVEVLGDDGELILTDQRGAGESRPALRCDLFLRNSMENLKKPPPAKIIGEQLERQLAECLARFDAVDFSAYQTKDAADDAEDIRRALTIPRWDLIGFSYATRVALETAARYPDGARALLLDSVYPFDAETLAPFDGADDALNRINESCKKDSHCKQYGDLRKNINAVAAQFAARPPSLFAKHPRTAATVTVSLTPDIFAAVLAANLYDEQSVAQLPKWIVQLTKKDFTKPSTDYFLRNFLMFALDDSFSELLYYNITCAENRRRKTTLPGDDFPAAVHRRYEKIFNRACDKFFPDKTFSPAATTGKPALIIAGDFDHATPPQWAEAVARRLPAARLIKFPAAHTPLLVLPCAKKIARAFLAAPAAPLIQCAARQLAFH